MAVVFLGGRFSTGWQGVAPSSVTALGRDTSCPRCGIRFPGPLGHGNRAAAWLCPRFIRHRRRFGHSPPRGRRALRGTGGGRTGASAPTEGCQDRASFIRVWRWAVPFGGTHRSRPTEGWRGRVPFNQPGRWVATGLAGHIGPALRRETLPFTIHPPLVVVAAGYGAPYGGSVVTVYHSTGGGSHCYRVAGRRASVTAREVRAAAGTSALGVGGGPYDL